METKKLNKLDLIFEHIDPKEVLIDAFSMDNDKIIEEIIESGLKGRGGAGFPTGMKWKFCAEEKGKEKYIICNADEGEPGTFKDREILDRVAYKVYSGMAIAGKVVGAKKGIVYLRSEYKFLLPQLRMELDGFHKLIKEIGYDFNIDFSMGSGAYICGEESALFESIEGRRGEPRNKPPYPTQSGLFGKPTVINNVETLVNTVIILKYGSEKYKKMGTRFSTGAKVFSVSGDTPIPGIYELELGMSVLEFVNEFGDGDTKSVQVGGASGFAVPRKLFASTVIGFEGVPTGGSVKLFNSSRSMYNVLHNYLEFFVEESCGQCTPCRVGCQQLLIGVQSVKKGEMKSTYLNELTKLAETMKIASKCGLGQSVGNAFNSIVENFREEVIY